VSQPPVARQVALDLLIEVLERQRPLDEAMAASRDFAALEPRDRAFVHRLVLTTLRRLGTTDALLAGLMARPLPAKRVMARHILRLGAAQLLLLDTPAHAAVDTAVALAAARHEPKAFVSLVNAVLRRVAAEGGAILKTLDSARLDTPPWLWTALCEAYGETAARAIAQAHAQEPPLDLSCRTDAAGWAGRLGGHLLPSGTVRLHGHPRVEALEGFEAGAWWVQDAAAALPVRLLGDIDGRRIIEIGAAPGGKTAQMAAAGAQITAIDRSPNRLALLRENLARLKLAAEVVSDDARRYQPAALADAVLIDAPCSATGTIRRHPEMPYLRDTADLGRLAALQDELIDAGARMVKPGGTIVFATCSLLPEEGEQRIDAALARNPDLALEPVTPEAIGGMAGLITARGMLRTLPCHLADQGGMDGFFAARLLRLT